MKSIPHGAAVVVIDKKSFDIGQEIASFLPAAEVHELYGKTKNNSVKFSDTIIHLQHLFREGHPIIGIFATGILVRALGPLLGSKFKDPPILSVANDGSVVVPVLGGHRGANLMSRYIAKKLGGVAAVTNASETILGFALDAPPAGWVVEGIEKAKEITAAILDDVPVKLNINAGKATWLKNANIPIAETADLEILVTDRENIPRDSFCLRPPVLSLGVGCVRNCKPDELISLATKTIADAGLSKLSIGCVVSVDIKSNEAAVHRLAEYLAVPARFFPVDTLELETPRLKNPSKEVYSEIGCHGVAEAAALAAVGLAGELLVSKKKSQNATCAIGRSPGEIDPEKIGKPRGRLAIVGVGPGKKEWRTMEAISELRECSEIIGYGLYIDLIGDLAREKNHHSFELTQEEDRARFALDLAIKGKNVALVSSGDAGIYAMAALVFELLESENRPDWDRLDIVVIPGVSALQAAAAKIGAPIGHDFCTISLSDLLTPWGVIENRIQSAAKGDFVIAFYNPVSKKRRFQMSRALNILLKYRASSTPVVLAQNLGRKEEKITVKTLGEISINEINMLTIVLIGSSNSRFFQQGISDRVYTPRGYRV